MQVVANTGHKMVTVYTTQLIFFKYCF